MPILDRQGNHLVSYDDFPLNDEVHNIEFGAGVNYFGKKEFPNCFLTDIQPPSCDHFLVHPDDYEKKECHFLDSMCNYLNADFGHKTFYNLIFCNPFNIGFIGQGHADEFINRATALLNEDGKIYILGNTRNPWTKSRSIRKYLSEKVDLGEVEIEVTTLDENHSYIAEYTYKQCDMVTTTTPNELIIIKKLRQ